MSKYSAATKSEQLLRLSDQVSRVAQSLAELATGDGLPEPDDWKGSQIDVSEEAVARLIELRTERARYLGTDLFADPVWDIMLFLLHAEITRRPVALSSASLASCLPAEVTGRWLASMVERGLIAVHHHPNAAGGQLLELTREASRNMRRYFREVVEKR